MYTHFKRYYLCKMCIHFFGTLCISLHFVAPMPYFNTFASNKAIACWTPSSAIFYTVGLWCNTTLKGNILLNYCRQMNGIQGADWKF